MPNLALFDFDGTITNADTFTPFLHYAIKPKRLALGKLFLAPVIMAYKMGFLHGSTVRSIVVWFGFRGKSEAQLRELGSSYGQKYLQPVIRPKAVERILWHKAQGDIVVLVSASLDIYLSDWCKQLEIDLISTKLESRRGILTGWYHEGDCTGEEKARRIRLKYDLNKYPVIYAYGDTLDDGPMLKLADKKFFRWQEVNDFKPTVSRFGAFKNDPNNKKRVLQMSQEEDLLEELVADQ